eukprot:TRINITY_DN4660_c0_g1_i2.p1 TRINITY_DN4660_c0_g1~~TRINITY_DN4660_c0_g1_i2.p1  ORF type:complete len:108 (+),score=0.05 TRINITY_DN4660_c0_g1_i2:48-371(+)
MCVCTMYKLWTNIYTDIPAPCQGLDKGNCHAIVNVKHATMSLGQVLSKQGIVYDDMHKKANERQHPASGFCIQNPELTYEYIEKITSDIGHMLSKRHPAAFCKSAVK